MDDSNIDDRIQMSLLDIGLNADQILTVQNVLQEEGMAMYARIFIRFEEEGFSHQQSVDILFNMFGFLMKSEHVDSMDPVKKLLEGQGE